MNKIKVYPVASSINHLLNAAVDVAAWLSTMPETSEARQYGTALREALDDLGIGAAGVTATEKEPFDHDAKAMNITALEAVKFEGHRFEQACLLRDLFELAVRNGLSYAHYSGLIYAVMTETTGGGNELTTKDGLSAEALVAIRKSIFGEEGIDAFSSVEKAAEVARRSAAYRAGLRRKYVYPVNMAESHGLPGTKTQYRQCDCAKDKAHPEELHSAEAEGDR